jgi:lantibiotic biosynthesis protein
VVRVGKLFLGTHYRARPRYGGAAGIELVEELFHADSEAVLGIVQLLEGDAAHDARWRLVVRGMDQLLGDLGFAQAGKREVMAACREGLGREFRVTVDFERQLGDRFRVERKPLELLLDPSNDATSELAPGLELLRERSSRIRPIATTLRDVESRLESPLHSIAADVLHMHANRLLRSSARAQELIMYDLLLRIYEGKLARERRSKKAP